MVLVAFIQHPIAYRRGERSGRGPSVKVHEDRIRTPDGHIKDSALHTWGSALTTTPRHHIYMYIGAKESLAATNYASCPS